MSVFGRIDAWWAQRFPATRAMARLGTITSVLSGLAVAFQIGGPGGYALPLGYLLGAPTNFIAMRLLDLIHPIPRGVIHSAAEWNIYLFLFSACIALNWTLLGLAADVLWVRPPSHPRTRLSAATRPVLTETDLDPLVKEFEELERRRRVPGRPSDSESHRAA